VLVLGISEDSKGVASIVFPQTVSIDGPARSVRGSEGREDVPLPQPLSRGGSLACLGISGGGPILPDALQSGDRGVS
jgi:hypothetical protein